MPSGWESGLLGDGDVNIATTVAFACFSLCDEVYWLEQDDDIERNDLGEVIQWDEEKRNVQFPEDRKLALLSGHLFSKLCRAHGRSRPRS